MCTGGRYFHSGLTKNGTTLLARRGVRVGGGVLEKTGTIPWPTWWTGYGGQGIYSIAQHRTMHHGEWRPTVLVYTKTSPQNEVRAGCTIHAKELCRYVQGQDGPHIESKRSGTQPGRRNRYSRLRGGENRNTTAPSLLLRCSGNKKNATSRTIKDPSHITWSCKASKP